MGYLRDSSSILVSRGFIGGIIEVPDRKVDLSRAEGVNLLEMKEQRSVTPGPGHGFFESIEDQIAATAGDGHSHVTVPAPAGLT